MPHPYLYLNMALAGPQGVWVFRPHVMGREGTVRALAFLTFHGSGGRDAHPP